MGMVLCPTGVATDNHTQYTGKCSSPNLRFGLEDKNNAMMYQSNKLKANKVISQFFNSGHHKHSFLHNI